MKLQLSKKKKTPAQPSHSTKVNTSFSRSKSKNFKTYPFLSHIFPATKRRLKKPIWNPQKHKRPIRQTKQTIATIYAKRREPNRDLAGESGGRIRDVRPKAAYLTKKPETVDLSGLKTELLIKSEELGITERIGRIETEDEEEESGRERTGRFTESADSEVEDYR